ncbi:MAG: cardiolipin synthase [Planctomycetota bacterium]|nr:MAG: cardiolipin synthase [Planctomycetota bacterium]
MLELLPSLLPHLIALGAAALALVASAHAVLHKREVRAAVGWVGLIWLVPVVGAVLYALLGINRIQRRAVALRAGRQRLLGTAGDAVCDLQALERHLDAQPPPAQHLLALARAVNRVVARPLLAGNRIVPLRDGDEAYPEMVGAIEAAERSVALASYIFEVDEAGKPFIEALARAVSRGVAVRVLIDAVGVRYGWPPADRALRAAGVPCALFLRPRVPWRWAYLNLRNHRKLLVVDGRLGFTGGLNVRGLHLRARHGAAAHLDTHFRLEGPVVSHLLEVFREDWTFATGEQLEGEPWRSRAEPAGGVVARAISAGPDEDHEKLLWTILAALATARRAVRIVTPYFLPDEPLASMLAVAALRGVEVDVIIPERPNLRLVGWAARGWVEQVLRHGVRVWFSPPPFDHSKLMTVDGCWSLLGSANWDPRSLRLNFELDLECYDAALAAEIDARIERKRAAARPASLQELGARSLAVRLRDGLARLLTPYL